jgi:hypothetical protein
MHWRPHCEWICWEKVLIPMCDLYLPVDLRKMQILFLSLNFRSSQPHVEKQMRSNFKHTECEGSPFSVHSTYSGKKGVNTVTFKNPFERSIYHNQPTKASKEHGLYPLNTDGISGSCVCIGGTKVLIPQCGIFCHNRT